MKHLPIVALLLGPISSILVYLIYLVRNAAFGVAWHAEQMPQPWIVARPTLEVVALIVVPVSLALLLVRTARGVDRLLVLLTAGVALVLLREIHFEQVAVLKRATELAAYIGLPATVVLGVVWRRQVAASPAWTRGRPWLTAAIVAYVYSVVVSRRAFRFLPYEQPLHIPLEEAAETAAHLLVLVLAVCAWRSRPATRES